MPGEALAIDELVEPHLQEQLERFHRHRVAAGLVTGKALALEQEDPGAAAR